jgi:hypothetical protein
MTNVLLDIDIYMVSAGSFSPINSPMVVIVERRSPVRIKKVQRCEEAVKMTNVFSATVDSFDLSLTGTTTGVPLFDAFPEKRRATIQKGITQDRTCFLQRYLMAVEKDRRIPADPYWYHRNQ